MSSRQEEKAARRAEREAQEAAAAKVAARGKRLQLVFGAFLVLAILGGSVALLLSSGGKSEGTGTTGQATRVAIPPVKETNLAKAANLAKCKLLSPPNEGAGHVDSKVTYKSNPPASGDHAPPPKWASDGVYTPGNEPAPENWVHSLEHSRAIVQYAVGTPKQTIAQLETVGIEELNGSEDYHVLVLRNNTKMPYAVAAVAWDHVLGCETMNPQVFDAIRAFRKQWTDKGPENIPGRE